MYVVHSAQSDLAIHTSCLMIIIAKRFLYYQAFSLGAVNRVKEFRDIHKKQCSLSTSGILQPCNLGLVNLSQLVH
jgi:hypothetical protein